MSGHTEPLVSVLTPVYNGALYLKECIDSVLAQSYSNWDYTIVNNRSTDGTAEIAEQYAAKDKRIRVHHNTEFLDIIGNHNKAFSLISPESKYCKVVSADDWLLPEFLRRTVDLGEANPSIGLVCSYQLSGGEGQWYVRTDGLPYHNTVVPGREIARAHLLGQLDVLGNPTSNLYRCDLVRASKAFYPNSTAEADISACFESLRASDFGFVHQVLSYERIHPVRITTTSKAMNAYASSKIGDLREYGRFFLTPEESDRRLKELLDSYYEFLAITAVNLRGSKKFWSYHKERLRALGSSLNGFRLAKGVAAKLLDLALNPKQTVEKVMRRAKAAN